MTTILGQILWRVIPLTISVYVLRWRMTCHTHHQQQKQNKTKQQQQRKGIKKKKEGWVKQSPWVFPVYAIQYLARQGVWIASHDWHYGSRMMLPETTTQRRAQQDFTQQEASTLTISDSTHHLHTLLTMTCHLSLIHIWRCRRGAECRSRWSPYH